MRGGGQGFTEWTSVARGQSRFVGHYQPRIPRDLGHYTLEGTDTLRRQIAMARQAGLSGFVPYFYWFNGSRLLERPLETFLADPTLDFPFCLMWANENWTRRWDGSDHEVLISQDYRPEDEVALIDCFARHFRDPRYIRAEGRPLLMVYRAGRIPDTRRTLERWRKLWRERHGEAPWLIMAQSFDDHDPRPHGFDAAIEFPPHKLTQRAPLRNAAHVILDPQANPQIYAYEDIVAASLAEPEPAYPLIRTVVPGWDNDARRQGQGVVIHGATPAAYQAWLAECVARAGASLPLGEKFVCINAWNEWAEGAYLEPDMHFGAAFLNATARAVTQAPGREEPGRLLLVGHDAFPAGAQILLLHLGRALRHGFGIQLEFLLLGGGRALLAPQRERILVGAADLEILRHVLRRLGHGIDTILRLHQRVDETPADRGVIDFALAAERLGRLALDERCPGHALHPPGDHQLRIPCPNGARRGADGIQARAAEAVDGGRRDRCRQASQQQGHAPDIAVILTCLVGAAVIQIVHRLPIHTVVALLQHAQRNGTQIVGPHVLQRPA